MDGEQGSTRKAAVRGRIGSRGVAGGKMAKAGRGVKRAAKPGKRQLDAFLDALAETSNVAASARTAGLASSAVYRERRRCADFARRWHEALCEGFVRLETELLSEALMAANGNVKDATLKARAQKYRLGLALLAAHRSAVRGMKSAPVEAAEDVAGAKERLARRLAEMRERVADVDRPDAVPVATADAAVGEDADA
jgi:hypothetical protein